MTKPLDQLTVKEILDAAGEELDLISCDKQVKNCERIGSCLAHSVWTDVTQIVNNYFKSKTLSSLLEGKPVYCFEKSEEAGDGITDP